MDSLPIEHMQIRCGGFTWIDNAVIDTYGPLLSSGAFCLYCVVVRLLCAEDTVGSLMTELKRRTGLQPADLIAQLAELIELRLLGIHQTPDGRTVYSVLDIER